MRAQEGLQLAAELPSSRNESQSVAMRKAVVVELPDAGVGLTALASLILHYASDMALFRTVILYQ